MSKMLRPDEPDYKRIFVAVFMAAVLLIMWQTMVEWPRRQMLNQQHKTMVKEQTQKQADYAKKGPSGESEPEDNPDLTVAQRLSASPRVTIHSDTLDGSISLKGAKFDDLSLAQHRMAIEKTSPEVPLFMPNGSAEGYFAQAGWVSQDEKTKVPTQHTLWQADGNRLEPGKPVHLSWNNGEGVTFHLTISLDEHYLFTIAQKVDNKSGHRIALLPYAYINRTYEIPKTQPFLHEGAIGVMDGTLNEVRYQDLMEKGNKTYDAAGGWLGFSDHYWLTALIPDGASKVTFSHYKKGERHRYQADFLGESQTIEDGGSMETTTRLFAGAKELKLLDLYEAGNGERKLPPTPLFDRALDFGWFYFLAKPMVQMMDFLYDKTGNFGIAILIFVVCLRIVMFPLINKSYKSMAQMRALQPDVMKITERYADDQMAKHKALRELYKREKVNPAAGCLPIFIQIIVFLALFRGLNVMIEMRHAPFYGWIHDLSAADPSNLFTLFGLIAWTPPTWMHLGVLPILYTITMIIQTAQQPTPPDPIQAKMIKFMPYFLLFFFNTMAAGFVLYWTWSNIISIVQQHFITGKYMKPVAKPAE